MLLEHAVHSGAIKPTGSRKIHPLVPQRFSLKSPNGTRREKGLSSSRYLRISVLLLAIGREPLRPGANVRVLRVYETARELCFDYYCYSAPTRCATYYVHEWKEAIRPALPMASIDLQVRSEGLLSKCPTPAWSLNLEDQRWAIWPENSQTRFRWPRAGLCTSAES